MVGLASRPRVTPGLHLAAPRPRPGLVPPGAAAIIRSPRRAMSVMSDRWIRHMATTERMIEPFEEGRRREGVISYGLSSYGYDARIADDFKIFTNIDSAGID